MKRRLTVDPADAVPIWRQIEEGLRRLVASGALARGAPVPSVRELAKDLRINPATVAKAYQRLTEAGVLAVRRGEGTFVAAEAPALTSGERRRTLREGAERYASLALTLGAAKQEALGAVTTAWEDLGEKGGLS
jgi:GntR family transcriptional regulator